MSEDEKIKIAIINQKVDSMKETLDKLVQTLDYHIASQDKKFSNLGKKFAYKYIEKLVYTSLILVVGGIVTAAFTMLLK